MVRVRFNRKRQSTTYCGRICIFSKRFVTNYNFLNKLESAKFQDDDYYNSFRFFTKILLVIFQIVCGKPTLWELNIWGGKKCFLYLKYKIFPSSILPFLFGNKLL